MKTKVLHDATEKTFALIFESGDEVISELMRFAREKKINSASFRGIGAFQSAVLGYFDRQRKDYKKIPINEQVELLSILGDIALSDGEPKIHAHVVLGRSNASTLGGHLLEARVWPTLELILTESPRTMRRRSDPESGLALISFDS